MGFFSPPLGGRNSLWNPQPSTVWPPPGGNCHCQNLSPPLCGRKCLCGILSPPLGGGGTATVEFSVLHWVGGTVTVEISAGVTGEFSALPCVGVVTLEFAALHCGNCRCGILSGIVTVALSPTAQLSALHRVVIVTVGLSALHCCVGIVAVEFAVPPLCGGARRIVAVYFSALHCVGIVAGQLSVLHCVGEIVWGSTVWEFAL